MKRWLVPIMTICVVCAWILSVAQAQTYERKGPSRGASEDGSFEDSVDLDRFRQGNIEWDTQELIASGMKALHQDHQKILKELAEMKASLKKLENQR